MEKKLLVLGKIYPESNSSAAGWRMMQLLNWFKEHYEIHFATGATKTRFSDALEGIEIHEMQLNDNSFDEFVRALNPDIVLFDRFMTEEQFGWRVMEQCPDALRILDTEDLHFLRAFRKKNKDGDISSIRTDLMKRELLSILRSDLTLMISNEESNLLMHHYTVPAYKLLTVPICMDKQNEGLTYEERSDFLFVGNFLHEPNKDAIHFLKQEIWPEIRVKLKDAKLHIYGAYASEKEKSLHDEKNGFCIKGRGDDMDVITQKIRVSFCPVRFGAGIKGKVLEAMKNGSPVVTTPIGAEGIFETNAWCVASDTRDFIEKAIELYQSKQRWKDEQKKAYQLLQGKFNEQRNKEWLLNRVRYFSINIHELRKKDVLGQVLSYHSIQSSKYLSKWIMAKNKK